jgi:hypothetical protein
MTARRRSPIQLTPSSNGLASPVVVAMMRTGSACARCYQKSDRCTVRYRRKAAGHSNRDVSFGLAGSSGTRERD